MGGRGPARRIPGLPVLLAILGLSVAVPALVWGAAPASGSGGALLPGLRPALGVGYGAALLAVELLFCAFHRLRDAAVAVLVAAATVDAVFWLLHVAGLHVRTGAAAALTAGFGGLALGAGLLSGRLGVGHGEPARRAVVPTRDRAR